MITIQTSGNKTVIDLYVKRANLFFRILLLLVGLFPLPIILTLLLVDNKISPFAIFIACLFLGGLSFFIFRLLLWNIYGKETYTISTHEFTAINDYKWFKDNNRVINGYANLEILYAHAESPLKLMEWNELQNTKENEFILVFLVDNTPYVSVVKHSKEEMENLFKTAVLTYPENH